MAVVRRPCALSALFRRVSGQFFVPAAASSAEHSSAPLPLVFGGRSYSNYAKSPFVERIEEQYEYEVIKNPPEWKYVQRLLPFDTIPKITPKESYSSGWVPPKEIAINLPFFIPRTKNHQLPIYLKLTIKGNRKISQIRKIEGDIWLLNDEIKSLLKDKHSKYVETRVHEFNRTIEVKGDYVLDLQEWAYSKGF